MKFMIRAWQVKPTQNIKLDLKAMSLDALTRQLPEGYYSTFRTFDGCRRVLGLGAHLRRLYEPVARPDVDESYLRRQLLALLESYRPDEARVRLIMTKGGEVYIVGEPLKALPREVYETGVRVETTELHRDHPRLKSTAFIAVSDAERKHIAQEGIFEALLVKNGKILEGMTSNFFYVRYSRAERSEERSMQRAQSKPAPYNVVLFTAQHDILLGITRKTVLEMARGRGIEVKYEPLPREDISIVKEAFITSSSRGVVPVIEIDEIPIGQGRPGPVTKELRVVYDQYVMDHAESIWPAE